MNKYTPSIGDIYYYGEDKVKITGITDYSVSFTAVNEDWGCYNIPLNEARPGNKLTNREMLKPTFFTKILLFFGLLK